MRRREFIAGLAGASACSKAALAQQRRKRVVGFLHPGNSVTVPQRIVAFREGFAGIAGSSFEIEVVARLGNDRFDLLPEMARELIMLGVEAICAVSPPPLEAARSVTQTIPLIAMDLESDPVARGWVNRYLSRPARLHRQVP